MELDGRVTEKFIDGQWEQVEFLTLVKGDKFRLTDPDGPVTYKGSSEFTADSNAVYDDELATYSIELKRESE